jgi:PKHD-type hydroxylase
MVLSEQPIDRKITVVCLLNNIQEFRGGEFEMKFKSELYCPALKKGSVIAFPSFISHRVAPVMQGARYTATLWLTGPKFR